jgi:hypothetical protein
MVINPRGLRALGIAGFAALTVTLVSACNGNATFTATANDNGPATMASSAPATSVQNSDSGAGSDHSDGITTHPTAVAPAKTARGVSTCQPKNLTFSLGDGRQIGPGQQTQAVDMTNQASSTCTMEGLPTVDLLGQADGQTGEYDWTLARSPAKGAAKVTLRPGATAHFDLVFLSGDFADGGADKDVITVHKMVIRTPGDNDPDHSAALGDLAWAQDVVLQDGATHPGTYVMPVASGS